MAKGSKTKRKCRCCGAAMPPDCLWVCHGCQALGRGRKIKSSTVDAQELLDIARERETAGIDPLKDMDMAEISALAWLFRASGCGSYGKLREYVRATGKLPPLQKK